MRRDTGFYPDTPLSLNHPIMKDRPRRASDAPAANHPKVGAFGSTKFGTPASLGIKPGAAVTMATNSAE